MALRSPLARAMTTILVADDEVPIVELVRFMLEDENVQVVSAFDGAAALELARSARPDLALLDVQMPHLNGLEVCRRVRQDPECAHTRVVILSAAGQAADRARGFAAGAHDYLTKPFSPLALLALVRTLVPEVSQWPER